VAAAHGDFKENLLGTVFMHSVVSMDGFIADKNDDVGHSTIGTSAGTPRSPEAAASNTIIPELEAASRSHVHRRSTSGQCGRISARS
jgi:hypothetical protein